MWLLMQLLLLPFVRLFASQCLLVYSSYEAEKSLTLDTLYEAFDTNKDDRVDETEFTTFFGAPRPPPRPHLYRALLGNLILVSAQARQSRGSKVMEDTIVATAQTTWKVIPST